MSCGEVFPEASLKLLVARLGRERFAVLGATFAAVQKLTKAVIKALSCDGVIVTQFNGAPAGQTVFHLHVHIIPRYANLPLQPHHGGKPADLELLREQAARIAAAL